MRGVMIVVGVAAVQKFKWITLLFSLILLYSAVKIIFSHEDDAKDLENNGVMRLSRMFLKSTNEYDGDNFFLKERGVRLATPLFMCLVCIELSDLVFAIDSIPAVLGVSDDPFIVYSSNIFAIMSLRSLYILVSKAVQDLPYLRLAVGAVLIFVSIKMIFEFFFWEISVGISLLVVTIILGFGFGGSIISIRMRKGVDMMSGLKSERLMS